MISLTLLASIVLVAGVLATRAVSTVTWLVLIRMPILFGILLVVGPFLMPLNPLANNLLTVTEWWQFSLLMLLAYFLAQSCVYAAMLILRHAKERMGARVPRFVDEYAGKGQAQRFIAVLPYLVLLTAPMFIQVRRASSFDHFWLAIGVWVAGCALASVLLLLAEHFVVSLARVPPAAFWRGVKRALGNAATAGYLDSSSATPYPGHLRAVGGLVTLLGVYVACLVCFDPGKQSIDHVPAFAFVLFLCILLVTLLSAVSFFFDRYRIPVIAVVLLVGFTARLWSDRDSSDHYFEVEHVAGGLQTPFQDQMHENLLPQPDGKRCAVVVCAFGGGIQASAWTSNVLTRLHETMQQEEPAYSAPATMAESLSLISSVSGGSVGTMHYLEAWRRTQGNLSRDDLGAVRRAATRTSLSAACWGLVFHDLRRLLPIAPDRKMDRAIAMERAWARSLEVPCGEGDRGYEEATLRNLATAAEMGWFPGFALNATVAESGRRILFSNVDITTRGTACNSDFAVDIPLTTAARLSAAFPYVSPLARADDADLTDDNGRPVRLPGIHLGDGGYFDVGGIVTAIEWILPMLDKNAPKRTRIDRIALVLIPAFSDAWEGVSDGWQPDPPVPCAVNGPMDASAVDQAREAWVNTVLGPVFLMFRSRGGTQSVRGAMEVDVLLKLANRINRLDPDGTSSAGDTRLQVFAFPPPKGEMRDVLSWHLDKSQRDSLIAPFELLDARAEQRRQKAVKDSDGDGDAQGTDPRSGEFEEGSGSYRLVDRAARLRRFIRWGVAEDRRKVASQCEEGLPEARTSKDFARQRDVSRRIFSLVRLKRGVPQPAGVLPLLKTLNGSESYAYFSAHHLAYPALRIATSRGTCGGLEPAIAVAEQRGIQDRGSFAKAMAGYAGGLRLIATDSAGDAIPLLSDTLQSCRTQGWTRLALLCGLELAGIHSNENDDEAAAQALTDAIESVRADTNRETIGGIRRAAARRLALRRPKLFANWRKALDDVLLRCPPVCQALASDHQTWIGPPPIDDAIWSGAPDQPLLHVLRRGAQFEITYEFGELAPKSQDRASGIQYVSAGGITLAFWENGVRLHFVRRYEDESVPPPTAEPGLWEEFDPLADGEQWTLLPTGRIVIQRAE